jgi:CDP-4-dehydro-6-deoxyglucose reductase
MCATATNAEVILQVDGAHTASDIPTQVIDAKLSRMEEIDNGVFVAHVRTPRSSSLWFLAGQQVRISWGESNFTVAIASCPCNGMQLQFHLHVGVSEYVDNFIANAKKGMTVGIIGPFGECTLNEAQPAPIILISNDTGFATSKSIIEHAIALDWPHAVRLYRQFQVLPRQYMHNYCRSWTEALDDYAFMDFNKAAEKQLMLQLQKEPQLLTSANFYVAGQQQWFDAMQHTLAELGIEDHRIYSSVDDNA